MDNEVVAENGAGNKVEEVKNEESKDEVEP